MQRVIEAAALTGELGSLRHTSRRRPQQLASRAQRVDGRTWSFDYENRVFSTPIINLCEVDAAQRELEHIDNGAKLR